MGAVNGSTDPAIGPRTSPKVVVVGAGVSGCACAAALASAGLHVILMNSAMDRVGLPVYGPDLVGAAGEWREAGAVFEGLPLPLRSVWAQAATMPASGEAVLNIDRRKISIETKRALEQIPGLEFRQGFVTDVRLAAGGDDRQIEVETIFGEILNADAVVVAAGLSFGARVGAQTDTMRGGRYGEPASEGLRAALEALGAEFRETSLEVGPRVSARTAVERGWLTDPDGAGAGTCTTPDERLLPVLTDLRADSWPAGYPPAPHWQADLRVDRMVMTSGVAGREQWGGLPALSPDGAETAEVYLSPGSVFADELATFFGDEAAPIASRMPLSVLAATMVGVGEGGRMCPGGQPIPVWVVGRAAGAADYAASLSSGLRAASDIARSLDWPVVECTTNGEGSGAGGQAHR